MEANRAKEILWSDRQIPVQYRAEPVWIERIDEATRTAVIRNLHHESCQEVPLSGLTENQTGEW